jgi:hemerythrin-like domain-containing protein
MTTVVSKEWIEEVLDEHKRLREMLGELKEFLALPRPAAGEPGSHTWASDLSVRLVKLHGELFRHFRFEESAGLVEDVAERHPRAHPRLQAVIRQHPVILNELKSIMADCLTYSEGELPEDPRLRHRVGLLLDTLHHHEREETDLFQRLEYRDHGAMD